MKIVELKITDSALAGIDAVALVEFPAIEEDFVAFNRVKMAEMTWDDYPQKAVENAKRGIELNKEYNNKCATQVGKVRAQQLANGEKLSLDTIQRMRSFLIRQKGNYELATRRKDYSACGYISYLLWGGEEALPWAEKKLRQAGIEFSQFSLHENVSFDYDGVLTTAAGRELVKQEQAKGNHVYVISARDTKESMLDLTNELGINPDDVYAAHTNTKKLEWIENLAIDKHYDDNQEVISALAGKGIKFSILKSNIPQMPTNEPPQAFEGLEDACQPGYKAIGLKTKNGRKVPNCVPEERFEEELANYIIADILGIDEEDFDINVAQLPNYINEASSGGRKKKYFDTEEVLPSLLELKKNKFATQLAEKQMLMGPLMTPNKLIPRLDEETGDEYQVYFTADTIEKIAYKMMQDKLVDSVNIEHNGNKKTKDVYLVETWIVQDPEHDKSTLYGFKPVKGQWFGIYKIGDGRVWNEYVKTGKVKGFSVEGYFYNNILTHK